jgi:hypothetical protein
MGLAVFWLLNICYQHFVPTGTSRQKIQSLYRDFAATSLTRDLRSARRVVIPGRLYRKQRTEQPRYPDLKFVLNSFQESFNYIECTDLIPMVDAYSIVYQLNVFHLEKVSVTYDHVQ